VYKLVGGQLKTYDLNMKFDMSVAIGYKDIFNDFHEIKIEELLAGIPTKNSIEITSFFIAQLHSFEREKDLQIEFLKMWVARLPAEVHSVIVGFIIRTKSSNSSFSFLDNTSILILTEKILQNANDLELLKDLSPEQELKLFKAYLICSQEWIDKQQSNFAGLKFKEPIDVVKVLLPSQLPYQEIMELKDFRLQIIKAIYFFKFCENHAEFKVYLQIFLDEYGLENWQKYLYNLLTLYVRKFEELKTPSTIHVDNEFPEIINFLEELSIDLKNYEIKIDFLVLREKPVYQIDKNNFVFLNLNFLVDKIFQGIQFDFAKVLLKNKATFNKKLIKSTGDVLGIFGNEFSENGLFYSVMNFAFEKSKFMKFTGEEMKQYITAEPDYYMRDNSKIYIFEFKNIYLPSDVKHSYDYEAIKSEIFKKLVKNQQGSAKGVTQLVNTIDAIKQKKFKLFDDYNFENIVIYPVIVYVDFSFNLVGINHILNNEFKKQLEEKDANYHKYVKDLILIDLDSFIKFQDLFRDKTLKINNCFNGYIDLTKNHKSFFDRISTFNMFLHNKTRKLKYGSPKMMMEEIEKFIPKEDN
jgi:hypothetical protein